MLPTVAAYSAPCYLPPNPMPPQPPPSPSADEVVTALRAAAATGLSVHERAQGNLIALGYDIQDVCELLVECELAELVKHEPDHDHPRRNDYIAVLRIEVEGEPLPFYVKVALHLPEMSKGMLLSFKLWS